MQIIHYDLFAGIGGFSYALDTIFHDQEINHIFCEWEAFPTAVLKKHWPDATYYGDIADLVADTSNSRSERVCEPKECAGITIITGGFLRDVY
jgi:site-specific DNA-cytosine methylase